MVERALDAAIVLWQVTRWLVAPATDRRSAVRRRLFAPAAGVVVFVAVLDVLALIPTVPLSVQFQGIYHDIRREGGDYRLVYQEPPPWQFWRFDARTFKRREGDRLHYFARVFAPTGFRHHVMIKWEFLDPASDAWTTTDRVPLDVVGGRAIATLPFRVEEDVGTSERHWKTLRA